MESLFLLKSEKPVCRYFEEMREVSKLVKPIIMQITQKVGDNFPNISKEFFYYYSKRICSNKLLLRPFLFKVFLDLYGVNWKEHLELAAVVEIVNISTYQSNLAFDNKLEIKEHAQKSNQFISSLFSKFRVVNYILSRDNYSFIQKKAIVDAIIKALEEIYYGQFLDINELNINNLSVINSSELFDTLYQKRCKYIGSSLIEMIAEIAYIIADDENDNLRDSLKQFSYHFGLAGQVVNDLGDFANSGKTYTDRYFDIFNGKVTFPIREAILECNSIDPSIIITFIEGTDFVERIKGKTRNYIKSNVDKIEEIITNLTSSGMTCESLYNVGNLLTKSKLIN